MLLSALDDKEKAFKAIESITQFIARHSYDELLSVLGGIDSAHKSNILQSGYGYQVNIDNFRYLLSRFSIDEPQAAKELQAIFLKSGDDLRAQVALWLSGYNGKSVRRNNNILGELHQERKAFRRIIEAILRY